MKKLFSFLLLAAAAGGILWYESQPTTAVIPVESDQPDYGYQEPATTAPPATTSPHRQQEVDWSDPDVHMEVHGLKGDEVVLTEKIGKPQHLDDLPDDVRATIMSCPDVTDRDMVVAVDARLELKSSLAAKLSVDYRTQLHAAVYNFSDGLSCSTGNAVSYDLQPGATDHLSYWVVLSGVITPGHPDGDFGSYTNVINGPDVMLPNMERQYYSTWGPRVLRCSGGLMNYAKVWLAGRAPTGDETDWETNGCEVAKSREMAAGDS